MGFSEKRKLKEKQKKKSDKLFSDNYGHLQTQQKYLN